VPRYKFTVYWTYEIFCRVRLCTLLPQLLMWAARGAFSRARFRAFGPLLPCSVGVLTRLLIRCQSRE
jgi:hypothetical protein